MRETVHVQVQMTGGQHQCGSRLVRADALPPSSVVCPHHRQAGEGGAAQAPSEHSALTACCLLPAACIFVSESRGRCGSGRQLLAGRDVATVRAGADVLEDVEVEDEYIQASAWPEPHGCTALVWWSRGGCCSSLIINAGGQLASRFPCHGNLPNPNP